MSRSILIIEDNNPLREETIGLLTEEGYLVSGVANGEQALALLRGSTPALVLLDVHMPILDGYGFFAEMKIDPRLAQFPVVVLSTDPGGQDRPLCSLAGAWLQKPYSIDSLLQLVARYCGPATRPDR